MADYVGMGRTDAFKVRDRAALVAALDAAGVESRVVDGEPGNPNTVVLIADDWSQSVYSEEDDDYIDVDIPNMVAEHLIDGEIAVFEHVGSEELRCLSGYAIAVDSTGRREAVHIGDVRQRMEERIKAGN